MVLKGLNFGGSIDQSFGGPMDQSFVDRCYILGGCTDSGCTCAQTGLIFNNGLAGGGQQGGLHLSLFYGLLWGGGLVQSLSLIFTVVFLEYFSPLRTS